MTERQNPPSATNAERAESNSAGGLKLVPDSISDPESETGSLARIEDLLDRILQTFALAGAL